MNKNRFSPLFTKRLLRDSLVFDCLGKTFSLGVVTHRGAAVSDEAGTAMFPKKNGAGCAHAVRTVKVFGGYSYFSRATASLILRSASTMFSSLVA